MGGIQKFTEKKKGEPKQLSSGAISKTGSSGEPFPKKRLETALFVQSGAILALDES